METARFLKSKHHYMRWFIKPFGDIEVYHTFTHHWLCKQKYIFFQGWTYYENSFKHQLYFVEFLELQLWFGSQSHKNNFLFVLISASKLN